MVDAPNDRYSRYYAEKLWEMIPPVYRHEDGIAAQPGVLRALVEVLAEQAAIVRRSTDRLWEDHFIDWCDDWAVPYIGDLLGTRLVSAIDRRGRRTDVAKTIAYRRRAGTLAVLEQLITDITGWRGTAVEEFRRLVRHPHGLDPAPAPTGRFTATPFHGLPDLRKPRGAQLAGGPWDEFHYLPDVRRNRGVDGRRGITKLAFHLFRLQAFPVAAATPRRLAADGAGRVRFTFDPSGRAVPLFQVGAQPSDALAWRPALEWEMPAPIRCEVLANAEFEISEALIQQWSTAAVVTAVAAGELRSLLGIRFPSESRFRVRLGVTLSAPLGVAALHRVLADALVADCGKGVLLPSPGVAATGDTSSVRVQEPGGTVPREVTVAANLSLGAVNVADKRLVIDAEDGLGYFTVGTPPAGLLVTSAYGFSGNVGAGTYERSAQLAAGVADQRNGGGLLVAPAAVADVAVEVGDNSTYTGAAPVPVLASVTLQAANQRRPYVELGADWTFTATRADSALTLDGLWIGSRQPFRVHLVAAPNCGWSSVTLRHVTLDPGGADADNGSLGPVTLVVDAPVTNLTIEASILSAVVEGTPGTIETLTMRDSIVHATTPANAPVALRLAHGLLDVRSTTVIGAIDVTRIEASELLCTGVITVGDLQEGCVRFSAFPDSSVVPRAYHAAAIPVGGPLFTSVRFGDPGYLQLADMAPGAIARGGEDGTEIGAFHSLLNLIKLDGLRAKVDEFLPFGLTPLFITET